MAEGPKPRGNPNIRSVQKRFTKDADGVRDERIWRRGRLPGPPKEKSGPRQRAAPGERHAALIAKPPICMYDLKQAAKRHSEEGLNILLGCMRDPAADWGHRIRAVELLWAYGHGKPQQSLEVDVSHKFAVVPAVMSKEEWLATKGAGYEAHAMEQEMERQLEAAKRMGEAPTGGARHSNGAEPVLELKAEPEAAVSRESPPR
jgi:hypothetical protein